MNMITCKCENLCIGYGEKVVADGIDATLNGGELTCLLGRNGTGKSTLLRTLSAFQPALSGCVTFDGKDVRDMSPMERARMIGVVLTERTELRYMTVRELVGMGRAPYTGFWGTQQQSDREIIEEAMSKVGVSDFADRMVDTLSDGERQKVMIAKALAQQTPVIFLDEPTAFLDFPSKVETMQLLQSLCQDMGKLVFLSTHDVDVALQTSNRIWLMEALESKENGKKSTLAVGTPHELAQSGAISRFIERPGVTFDRDTMNIKIY